MIEGIRETGQTGVDQSFIPGLFALAALVLNWQAEADAMVTLVSTGPYTGGTRSELGTFVARHGE